MSVSFIRSLFELYYKEAASYRILFGPLRGLKMHYQKGMTFHTILGLTDRDAFRMLDRVFQVAFAGQTDLVAADLGANRGLYSLWLARQGYFETIHCFEPHPALAEEIRRNRALNGCEGIHVHALACADKVGQMDLLLSDSDSTSSLLPSPNARSGKISVETTSLDQFFQSSSAPHFIKMDIEGAGIYALPSAYRCLSKTRSLLYLESHSPEEDRAIGLLMKDLDYQAYRIQNKEWVLEVDEVFPAPNGVWGNLLVVPTEKQKHVTACLKGKPQKWRR